MQTGLLQCIGAYDILHRNVSSDAVSSLHRGRHRPSGIYVAIKSYKSTSEANQQATLEAQFLTTFRSCRSICTLREILKDDQGTHLIIDWYSKDLGSLIRMHPSGVPADEVLHHSVQILHGLACVHEHQVAYLALKPGKCMLTNQGKSSAIKLIHFNHASQINNQKGSSRRYDTPELLQHCRYDAPELLAGHAWDTAADIWSFGCVLAEMITGQALFPGSCPSMTLSCILNTVGGPPKPLLWTIRQRPALKAVLRDSLAFPLTINESPLAQRLGVLLQNNQPMLQVLLSCLNMDPDKRPTAQQLLEHQAFRESWLNFQRAQMYNSNDNRGSSPAAADSSARKLLALNSVASRVFNQNNGAEDGPRTLLSCPSNVVARSSFSNQEDERKPNPNLKVSALWRAASRNARDGMSDPGYGDGGAAMLMPAPPPAAAGDAPGPSRKFRVNLSVKNAPWQGDTSQMTEEQMKLRGQFEHFAGFGSFKTRASEAGFTPSEADQDRVTPALGGMGGAPLSLLAQNNKSERSVSEPGVWGPISAVPPLGAKPGASGLLQDFNSRLSGSMQNQGPPAEPAPPTEESGINGLSDKLQRMRQAVSMALRASVNARGTFGEGGAAEAAVAAVPAQG